MFTQNFAKPKIPTLFCKQYNYSKYCNEICVQFVKIYCVSDDAPKKMKEKTRNCDPSISQIDENADVCHGPVQYVTISISL